MDIAEGIIKLVQQHKHLYDKKDKNYKKRRLISTDWKLIAAKLHISENLARRKWRHVRDRYKRLRRIKESMLRRGDERYMRPYKYAPLLNFLDDCHSDSDKGSINDDESSVDSFSMSSQEEILGDTTIFNDDKCLMESTVNVDSNCVSNFKSEYKNSEEKSGQQLDRCKIDADPIAETNMELMNMLSSLKEKNTSAISKELSFCNNLACQLLNASFPKEIFAKFQMEVYKSFYAAVQEKCNLINH